MIVECVGAPGSGKTTTLDAFYKANSGDFARLRPKVYVNKNVFEGAIERCHLEIICEYARLSYSGGSEAKEKNVNYARFERLIAKLHESAHWSTLGGVVLDDEGLFKQFPVTMLAYLNSKGLARDECLKNRAFIIFDTEPAYQAEMIKTRKGGRAWSRKKRALLEEEFVRGLPDRINKYIQKRAIWRDLKAQFVERGVPHVVVDPARGVAFNAEAIGKFISEVSGSS
ncbi:MAG: hypothetical protein EA353_12645 [Puniceicoccaceae bacterium]|nr:MAG: hypothetical protein EA353_12645 [Puniceicoccaceae bacterium]